MAGKPVPITGPVLQWAMQDAGVSRRQLAQALGVATQEVQQWELGQRALGMAITGHLPFPLFVVAMLMWLALVGA
jgi:plasmid maintenance system antidote protein VapI